MVQSTPIPEGKYVRTSTGLDLHYYDLGHGAPVIFVHGSGPGASGHSNFKGNYRVFAERGYRVIIFDLPGYGLSSKPEDQEYELDFFVESLKELVDRLEIGPCVLVGNSLGGAIAIKYALDRPEGVTRLVLMGPGGLEERERYFQMEGIQRMMKDFAMDALDREGMRRLLSILVFDSSHVTDELLSERVPVCATQPKTVLSTMRVPNLSDRLREIKCPVLGFWGSDDKFCPVEGALKVLRDCDDARFLLVNQCGHWVMVEHRELFNRTCLEFLDNG
ncbi:4,5:9,10-diseco-3-hydroxy-5,9,17-trioxoandrosta-1(10),2-diene-4-oate hydrolase [Paraburkholderia sp. BL18I3N2]|uniref:alpha/beta fold hydrolase n=1 Tax=Paraburkholderia sp. BL18I3N2 TaxID=1938799 RepID=UPI000D06B641|nr:alpha/beta hydrolase [Paraburkholderia sp. BL18I3N2]PRX27336.1 4,5:9,10-diseco-3-hydroxy-5,9,17-trioxoandrosta-1(10),2-diene-4-oate hydrolase [Paraburkholderia sp. BL18I3N2]